MEFEVSLLSRKLIGGKKMLHTVAHIYRINYKYLLDYWLPKILDNSSSKPGVSLLKFLFLSNHKPNFFARQLASSLPQELKDTIAVKLISTADQKIIEGMNDAIGKNNITTEVKRLKIQNIVKGGKNMIKLEITLSEINYNELIKRMIPSMLENLERKDSKIASILSSMGYIPVQMITAALNVLTQDEKNELIAKIATTYEDEISKAITETLHKQHIALDINDISVRNI
jgi:hypothetical protein